MQHDLTFIARALRFAFPTENPDAEREVARSATRLHEAANRIRDISDSVSSDARIAVTAYEQDMALLTQATDEAGDFDR